MNDWTNNLKNVYDLVFSWDILNFRIFEVLLIFSSWFMMFYKSLFRKSEIILNLRIFEVFNLTVILLFFKKFFQCLFIFERERQRETECERRRGRERGRHRIQNRLQVLSCPHRARRWPELTNQEIMTRAEGRRLTNWPTQAPQFDNFFFKVLLVIFIFFLSRIFKNY